MSKPDTEQVIKTKNLILEPVLPSHAKKLYHFLQAVELYLFIPQDPPLNVAKLTERYEKWSKRQSPDGKEIWLNYAIYFPSKQDYVGTVQATLQQDNTYIAYETFPDFQKQGVAKEACLALLHLLFEEYNISTITAHTDTRNNASQKLLESLGFNKMETIMNADTFKGNTSHEYVYKLIRQS